MKTRWTILTLVICILVALYIRIVLPYHNVFSGEWIKFTSNDAYWQMMAIDRAASNFPHGGSLTFFQNLIVGTTWLIGLGHPSQHLIDTIAVYFPPIMAALTIITVYFIGKILFNRFVGILAAVFLAVLPGEWLGRSLLGFTDHHIAEVFFSSLAFLGFLITIKETNTKHRIFIGIITLISISICVLSWTSGILVLLTIGLYLAVQVIKSKNKYYITLLAVISVGGIAFVIYDWSHLMRLIPYINSSNTMITTQEMRPILFPNGTFTIGALWGNFTTALLIIPVAIFGLFRKIKQDDNALFLLIWSLVMLTAMLFIRRFAYYFAVNAALLCAVFTYWIYIRFKDKLVSVVVVCACLMFTILPCYQQASLTAKYATFAPSDAWLNALEWVENNTPEDSLILSWWDYGYWIEREAKRHAYTNPSQDNALIKNSAQMFLSENGTATIDADYIIVDYDMVMGKFWAIPQWNGESPSDYSDTYYIVKDGASKSVLLFFPEYYESLIVGLYNFNGQAVKPTQSIVIAENNHTLISVDAYGSYQEALDNMTDGTFIVGSSPFSSPLPLGGNSGYSLVYQSEENINGVPEVKIFKSDE